MDKVNWQAVGAVLAPFPGAFLGSYITRSNIKNWYDKNLKKPDWRPPNWAFGPVWTYLYGTMGYASYLVWRDGGGFSGEAAKLPLALYGTQLALNWAWTPLFFGAKKLKLAFYEICALWLAVAATGLSFYQVNKTAGLLFAPYIGWVSLATALNYCIQRDNDEEKID